MKTVINTLNGDVLYAYDETRTEIDLKENEQIIDAVCDLPFDSENQKQRWIAATQSFIIVAK